MSRFPLAPVLGNIVVFPSGSYHFTVSSRLPIGIFQIPAQQSMKFA